MKSNIIHDETGSDLTDMAVKLRTYFEKQYSISEILEPLNDINEIKT